MVIQRDELIYGSYSITLSAVSISNTLINPILIVSLKVSTVARLMSNILNLAYSKAMSLNLGRTIVISTSKALNPTCS